MGKEVCITLSLFTFLLFGLLLTILILWLDAAALHPLNEFPTLSDLLRENTLDVRTIYIAFYPVFCITALTYLVFDVHYNRGVVENEGGPCTFTCCLKRKRHGVFNIAKAIYYATTLYAIFSLLLVLLVTNKQETKFPHYVWAAFAFGSLVVRSIALAVRRFAIRSSPCAHDWTIIPYTINILTSIGSLIILIIFLATGMPELECTLVFCLLPDPLFQLLDYWVETNCEYLRNKAIPM